MEAPKLCNNCHYCELGVFQYAVESAVEQEWHCTFKDVHFHHDAKHKWGCSSCPNYKSRLDALTQLTEEFGGYDE